MEYKIISKEAFQVAGIRKVTEAAGGVWAIVKADGSMKKMQEIAGGRQGDAGAVLWIQRERPK